ncbi:MAG: flavin reductase family protein [Alkalilacustris sp.]
MTDLDLEALTARDRYKILSAVVVPRPVAWVTSVDADGVVNAAPYSFFNVFGQDPALIVLGLERRPDGAMKDTARNIRTTGEMVVNLATPAIAKAMVATAAAYPPDRSETEALGLATVPSSKVAPPRLRDAAVAIECRHRLTLSFSPERDIIIAEAVALSARDGLIDPDRLHVDWQGDYPVARLFADRYARLEEIAPLTIPPPPEG